MYKRQVTGLVLVDTALHWTPFGQGVMLVLVQLGGLGFEMCIRDSYVVIEEEEDGGDYIRMGSSVTVLDKEFGEEETYKIVGSQEADPMKGTRCV